MKVLFGAFYSHLPLTGLATFNRRLVKGLRDKVDLHLLVGSAWVDVHRRDWSEVAWETYDGLPALRVERDFRRIDRCTAPGDNPAMEAFIEMLARAMRERSIDLVHLADWELLPGIAVFAAANRAGIPWLVTPVDYRFCCPQVFLLEQLQRPCSGPDPGHEKCAHCLATPHSSRDSRYYRILQAILEILYRTGSRRLLPARRLPRLPAYYPADRLQHRARMIREILDTCSRIVTFSQAHSNALGEMLNLPSSLFEKVPLQSEGPPPGYRPDPDRFSRPLRFLWIHRLAREWGAYLVLDAWRQAAPPTVEAQLWMYSTPGAERDIRAAGYGDLVDRGAVVVREERVMGREAEVLSKASAVIWAPLWNTNGYSFDPFAYEFPVIYAACPAFTEFLRDGINGFSFFQGSSVDLAKRLRMLIRDPEQLARAALNNTFHEEYGLDWCGRHYVSIYESVLLSRNR